MAFPIDTALTAMSTVGRYCARQPATLFNVARHAVGARLALPLDMFRWLIGQFLSGGKAPKDVTISARPPALHFGATVDAMGATIRAQISVSFSQLVIRPQELQITLRLADLDLQLVGESASPVAGLIKSGALDLSKPGKLVKMMPQQPPAIVSITDDEVVIDLMRIPGLAENATIDKLLRVITPVANIANIRTSDDMLVIGLRISPTGVPAALMAATG